MIKKCEECQKEFEIKKGHNKQRFCSKSCALRSRYKEDEGLFRSDVDDYIQKYILGLIITVGCISRNGYNLTICVSLKDKEMIEKIRDIVCKNKKIYKDGNIYQVKWRNSNDIIYLNNLKISERKTYTVGVPYFKENMWHLIRGLFDGDGCVYNSTTTWNKTRYTYKYISFTTGSENFVNDLSNFFNNNGIHCTIHSDSRRTNSDYKTYYIKIYKNNDVQKFKNLIYDNCNDWKLERKYNLFI